jgi:hypothetical protein
MTLVATPFNGSLSLSAVNTERGVASNTKVSLDNLRRLAALSATLTGNAGGDEAGYAGAPISLRELYGCTRPAELLTSNMWSYFPHGFSFSGVSTDIAADYYEILFYAKDWGVYIGGVDIAPATSFNLNIVDANSAWLLAAATQYCVKLYSVRGNSMNYFYMTNYYTCLDDPVGDAVVVEAQRTTSAFRFTLTNNVNKANKVFYRKWVDGVLDASYTGVAVAANGVVNVDFSGVPAGAEVKVLRYYADTLTNIPNSREWTTWSFCWLADVVFGESNKTTTTVTVSLGAVPNQTGFYYVVTIDGVAAAQVKQPTVSAFNIPKTLNPGTIVKVTGYAYRTIPDGESYSKYNVAYTTATYLSAVTGSISPTANGAQMWIDGDAYRTDVELIWSIDGVADSPQTINSSAGFGTGRGAVTPGAIIKCSVASKRVTANGTAWSQYYYQWYSYCYLADPTVGFSENFTSYVVFTTSLPAAATAMIVWVETNGVIGSSRFLAKSATYRVDCADGVLIKLYVQSAREVYLDNAWRTSYSLNTSSYSAWSVMLDPVLYSKYYSGGTCGCTIAAHASATGRQVYMRINGSWSSVTSYNNAARSVSSPTTGIAPGFKGNIAVQDYNIIAAGSYYSNFVYLYTEAELTALGPLVAMPTSVAGSAVSKSGTTVTCSWSSVYAGATYTYFWKAWYWSGSAWVEITSGNTTSTSFTFTGYTGYYCGFTVYAQSGDGYLNPQWTPVSYLMV